ncbi:MAG: holo-ACP synthase [Pseudomonadota bacterium]
MIYGIGVDIVSMPRMKNAIDRWGDAFLNKVFTQAEQQYCLERHDSGCRFALRFAAKEALLKALGIGLTSGITLKEIEIINNRLGKPSLLLHGKAHALCFTNNITTNFLSLSDDGNYAIAMVVLEKSLHE